LLGFKTLKFKSIGFKLNVSQFQRLFFASFFRIAVSIFCNRDKLRADNWHDGIFAPISFPASNIRKQLARASRCRVALPEKLIGVAKVAAALNSLKNWLPQPLIGGLRGPPLTFFGGGLSYNPIFL
jgi:hypothetical protein